MNTRKAWTVYIVLRLLFVAVPFAALMLMGWPWWLAAIVATLVAVSLSVIFLSNPREVAARSIHVWRERGHTADNLAEDAEMGLGAETDTAETNTAQTDTAGPAAPESAAESTVTDDDAPGRP